MDKEQYEKIAEANRRAQEVYVKAMGAHDDLMKKLQVNPEYASHDECGERAGKLAEIFSEAATMFKDIRAHPPFFQAAANAYQWFVFLRDINSAKMWLDRICMMAVDASYVLGNMEAMHQARQVSKMEAMVEQLREKKADGKPLPPPGLEVVEGGKGNGEEDDE